MSTFVIVISEQCPACTGMKVKDKMGVSFLDKVKEWVSPYVSNTVEITMKHNGDRETLSNKHKGLISIVRALPSFFIFTTDVWRDKNSTLPNSGYRGARREMDIQQWAKEQSGKRPSSRFSSSSDDKVDVEVKLVEAPPVLATAGSISVQKISYK